MLHRMIGPVVAPRRRRYPQALFPMTVGLLFATAHCADRGSLPPSNSAGPPVPESSERAEVAPPPTPAASSTQAIQGELEAGIVEVVSSLEETRAYCASLQAAAQPVSCTIWLENAPATSCPIHPAALDDCLWSVYVGENQSTHTVRWATFLVNPSTREVIGVSDWMCGTMELQIWRQWRATLKPGSTDDCPESAGM